MAEFEDITDAERVQIAQHFLLNSPPAQYGLVSEDVKKLLPEGCLPEAVESGIAKTYNFKNCRVVKTPLGGLVALHKDGEVNESHSIDTSNGAVFKINHLTMETSEGDEGVVSNQDSSLELKRAAMQADVDAYIKEKFPCDAAAGSVYAKDGALTIAITGERVNLRNMYSGKWNSQFIVRGFSGDKTATLSGDIKVHNHYFEEGNIQMQTAKPVSAKEISFSSEKDLAEKIIAAITEVEQETQKALHFIVNTAHVSTLKELRKASTVHKVKMAWNKNAAKMVGQLTGKSQDSAPK